MRTSEMYGVVVLVSLERFWYMIEIYIFGECSAGYEIMGEFSAGTEL